MNCAGPESFCLARRARHVACVLIAMVFAAQAATAELPNLSDPKVAMETWMRLKGDLAGRVTYEWGTYQGICSGL